MNKNSNTYIIAYAAVMVVIVAAGLSFAALSLKGVQAENARVEKMGDILRSIGEGGDADLVKDKAAYINEQYKKYIVDSYAVNVEGDRVEGANAFALLTNLKAEYDKIFKNEIITDLIKVLGCGVEVKSKANKDLATFDLSLLRFSKVIICTDADVDGAHIRTLLLTFLYRFMPELIQEGHVYIAMPPLYKAVPKRGQEQYLYDDIALDKYRKTHKDFTLQRYKGLGEMDASQLWETTLNPESRCLKRVEIEDARLANEMTELLMGSDVEPRREFIHKHGREAQLDI